MQNTYNPEYTNKLINEKSPYLLQHAHNPVNWFTWSEEAFAKAKNEDKPIFLSIGYSTCHWCHVMEGESFEDEEVAEILNKYFVAIKVDREERPDIDHIYMNVCQALTGQGGWPLTIIMTPDKKPFFAGTYIPKHTRYGRTGLVTLLQNIEKAWKNNRDDIVSSGEQIVDSIKWSFNPEEKSKLEEDIDKKAFEGFKRNFDRTYGGFGEAPKFPIPHNLMFLLRFYYKYKDEFALEMVEKTLEGMYKGGIFDHVGLGFARYSTDHKWIVPHFEKMLYDNALLAMAYIEAYQITKKEIYAEIARKIFDFAFSKMLSETGGFYSALDADSEGEEGKYYIWDYDEIINILGEEKGIEFCKTFNVTREGNFEGKNILNLVNMDLILMDEDIRKKLLEHRERRVSPHRDDKILTSWNGLMIAALSMGARILKNDEYLDAAIKAADFIFDKLVDNNGRLLSRYRDGEAKYNAYAEDYAFMIWGLIELYEASFEMKYLNRAIELNKDLIKYFWDENDGGLFIYGSDSEQLIARPKEIYDSAIPSGNSVAAYNWIRLSKLTGDYKLEEYAQNLFVAFGENINGSPSYYSFALMAFLTANMPSKEVVVAGLRKNEKFKAVNKVINSEFRPELAIVFKDMENSAAVNESIGYISDYAMINNDTTIYVCENQTCSTPTNSIEEFEKRLNGK